MKLLHIGFVAQGWSPGVGGIESHTADLVRELQKLGHRVSALCLDYSGKAEAFGTTSEWVSGVEVTRMSYGYHDHDSLSKVVRNRAAEDVFGAWLDRVKPDLLHIHHLTGFGLGVIWTAKARGVKQVMTLHDYWTLCPRGQMFRTDGHVCLVLDPDLCGACLAKSFPHVMPSAGALSYGPFDGLDRDGNPNGEPEGLEASDSAVAARRTEFAMHCLAGVDLLTTPSARTREIFCGVGLAPEKITVVENGIEISEIRHEVNRQRATLPERVGVRLGIVGSVLPSKGVLELALAYAQLRKEGRAGSLTLEVHGNMPPYHGDSTYGERLLELASQTPGLEVVGPFGHGGLAAILSRLDGVAAPSRWEEVFGLTVREARAAGLPVLVSDAGGLPGVVGGGAGLVIPRDNQAAWVDALDVFANDTEQRNRWASYPAPLQSSSEMALAFEGLYRSIL
jgi:glycosyltransferase involved in cell wall biosynthesis